MSPKMRDEPAATQLLVVFAFFRTFVGFVHDIAPCAQRFGDAGKPCFFGGRKTVHMVTDFVEHIDDAVDALERVGDFCRPSSLPSSPLEKKCTGKPCSTTPAVCAKPGCSGIVGGAGGGASKCDRHWERCPLIPKLEGPVPSRTPGSNWVTSESSIFRNELSIKLEKSSSNGCTLALMSAETPSHGKQ